MRVRAARLQARHFSAAIYAVKRRARARLRRRVTQSASLIAVARTKTLSSRLIFVSELRAPAAEFTRPYLHGSQFLQARVTVDALRPL